MTYEIVCTRGPMKGRRWTVTPRGLKIGRAEGCEIQVGDVAAELYHCIVKLVGGKPVVMSLASENGVDVNGMYVGEAVLDPMDKINIGGMRFVVSASGSGRGGAIVRKVVPLLILLALAGSGAYFYRNRPKSVDVAGKPKPTSESVSTNRVVRIVDEMIVTTNRIINIVNNIVVTNYVEDIRRGGVLVSSRVIDMQKPQVAEPEPIAEPAVEAAEIPEKAGTAIPDMYCVIDLSAGPDARKYPVAYYSEPPDGDFNVDEYKTTKLVLQLIKPGSFKMCRKYDVTLTKPFFCGIFEVTQKQYKMVMGVNPSGYKGDKRPVETVSYDMIRGKENGSKWPESSAVDGESFMGRLRARTGLGFDLPTEAQWEYACRAGTTSTYSYGDFVGADHMWYSSNSSSQTHDVGLKLPNSWGFYDMHGNVWEWCLDWYGDLTSGVNDPVGASTGMKRVPRGGGWKSRDSYCTSFHRTHDNPSLGNNNVGFRLALPMLVEDVERLSTVAQVKPNATLVRAKDTLPTAKELEPDTCLPYKVIDSKTALMCGGAAGGDEVRIIKNSSRSYDLVHLFTEASRPKTLVIPKKNSIQPRSGRFLVVAGGGAAFLRNMTGGGGAGGVVEQGGLTFSDGTAYAYVGAGGLTCGMGCNGEDSILTIGDKTYIAIGGGSGDGYSGGSGGGAGGGGGSFAFEGKGLQPESPTGGIGLDGTSTRLFGPKKRGGVCGGSPNYQSPISGNDVIYAKGGLYYETVGRGMAGDENSGSGADGHNGGRRSGLEGGSGIIIVRYNVLLPTRRIETEVVQPTFPTPDKCVMSEWKDGIEWHYFKERNYAVIGCHANGGSDFPDCWIPAVDTNALVGVVQIPGRIGMLPVKKIGKGAFQGCAQVTKFVVPEGVSECEDRAFARCPLLESVEYPKTLAILGEGQVYRSPLINTLIFKSLPPQCITGRCPLKGIKDPIHLNLHELNITIPFEFVEQWRNWSQRESQRLIVCMDRCHRNPGYVEFSPKDLEKANHTSAGFIGEAIQWASDGDVRDRMDWLVERAEDLWRKYAASGRNRVLSIPCLYSIGKGNGRGIPEHTAVIYATFMYFNAREPVYFMADIDDYAMIIVDGDVVVGLSEKGCEKNECKEPVMFASGGWHRVVVVAANDRDVGGAVGAEGGVYYSRSDNKHWHLFESNPNGKEFRITAADARRAVAEIEKARRKKQK